MTVRTSRVVTRSGAREVNRIPGIRYSRPLSLMIASIAIAITACSGTNPSAVVLSRPQPSHLSPQGATTGFFSGFVRNDKNACTFAAEGATPFCLLALENTTSTFANLGIGEVTVKGTEALVTVIGTLCVTQAGSTNCTTNNNLRIGQPDGGGHQSFASLYKAAVKGIAISKGAVPCERIKSEWYVSLAT